MSSLKHIRERIKSVQSTKKITSAMKMIAAAKLRKAQDRVTCTRPYADLMIDMLAGLISRASSFEQPPKLLVGTGKEHRHVVVIITSERGLCGGYNTSVVRTAVRFLRELEKEGKPFEIVTIGRKARDLIRSYGYGKFLIKSYTATDLPAYWQARHMANPILENFERGAFDVCTVFYNQFISAISQEVVAHRMIPYTPFGESALKIENQESTLTSMYEFEPTEEKVLNALLPQNFYVQIFRALLENNASEQAARMTAMDGATRNAEDMIDKLNLTYNRTRQADVTRELIEVISGAEAL
jgi:F-type H+-transporting ATPase subunit gamma